jgi:hypothetical protein
MGAAHDLQRLEALAEEAEGPASGARVRLYQAVPEVLGPAAGRTAASGRVAASGRSAASGRTSSAGRREYLLSLGSSLRCLYDASFVQTSGSLITQWNDQSVNGLHATATGSKRATLNATDASFGGQPSATFAGAQVHSNATPAQVGNTNWTMGVVFKTTTISSSQAQFSAAQTNGVGFGIDENGANERNVGLRGAGFLKDTTSSATTNPEFWIARRNTTTVTFYVGTSLTQHTLDFPNANLASSSSSTCIGALNTSLLFPFNGRLARVWFVSLFLSDSQLADVAADTQAKYGVL